MRYKVGDVVRVRSDLDYDATYYMDDRSESNDITEEMMEKAGTLVKIEAISGGQYRVKGVRYVLWTDEMFEDNQTCAEITDLL